MKKLLTATAACALFAGAAQAEDIKLGIIFGFTGPIESLTGSMAAASEAAIAEVNASGLLLDGSTVTAIRADSTCVDSAAATAAATAMLQLCRTWLMMMMRSTKFSNDDGAGCSDSRRRCCKTAGGKSSTNCWNRLCSKC